MSRNSSSKQETIDKPTKKRGAWWMAIILPAWVLASFVLAQLLVAGVLLALKNLNVSVGSVNENLLSSIIAASIYVITFALIIVVPRYTRRSKVTPKDIGLDRLPKWTDILLTPVGLIVYLIASALLMLLATAVLPWFDSNEVQNTGFAGLSQRYEYILAFITLVVLAPVAEEVVFRGYLLGKLRTYVPVWVAILITSVLFGFIHGAWNLAIDTFALSVVLCLLRISTGSIWAPILLHMTKNAIAFYILFINPLLFNTLGG